MKRIFVYALFLIGVVSCHSIGVEQIPNGVVIMLDKKSPDKANLLRLQVVSDNIIRVTATASGSFSDDTSLMTLNAKLQQVPYKISQQGDTLQLATAALRVLVNVKSGRLHFTDTLGNAILTEAEANGKTFKPTKVNGQSFYEIHSVFNSPSDEAFYGLGQHQADVMNFKGRDVELYQYNSMVAVPFVVSDRNYGILWDNYSLSKFGDIRDYEPISTLRLFDADGKEGGLTALYRSASDTTKVFVKQTETKIDYEFLNCLKNLPAMFPLGQGIVSWKGAIASDSVGVHKFRFYVAGYGKVWVDGKLIVDRWRQCWNPTATYFTLNMEKGKKYPIHIEWNPDGGESYIGLRCLTPLPAGEQEKLSLYSQVANQIDYYFIKGSSIDNVISGYRELTGKAPMMPKWAMGFWQSRERYKTQDELLGVLNEYRKRNIPIDNIVMDWFYWAEDKWGDHNFDSIRFPNPVEMLKQVHQTYNAHFMISVWPKFYEGVDNYNKMNEKGFLYKQNILDKQVDWVGKGYVSTFYDAYNPEARKLFWQLINERLFAKGVDAWWMDASEPDIHSNRNITDRQGLMNPTALGPAAQYFNAFPLMNAKGMYEGQRGTNPDQRVFILTRSAYAGQQRFAAATWSGDIGARWEEMKIQISAGLNFCMSGIPYWTMDIGGFAVEKKYETASGADLEEWRERMARWYQFGAFCPIFRAHGQLPYREIYNIAPESHPAFKAMLAIDKLRYRLMPYIYALVAQTHFSNYTIMRGLPMDFESDKNVLAINDQFMFGPSILVNPVTTHNATSREVYLPASSGWYNLANGKYLNGGQTIHAEAPLTQIPLFIKAGSIVPYGPEIAFASQKVDAPVTIYVYAGSDASFTLYEDENTNYNYEKGNYLKIALSYTESSKQLRIGEASGSYAGMPASRTFNIVFVNQQHPLGLGTGTDKAKTVEYVGKELIVSE